MKKSNPNFCEKQQYLCKNNLHYKVIVTETRIMQFHILEE